MGIVTKVEIAYYRVLIARSLLPKGFKIVVAKPIEPLIIEGEYSRCL